MNFSPERFLGLKLHIKADFPNPSYYNVKLFSLLGSRPVMWDCVNRGSMVSETSDSATPRKWSMDFDTIFQNLNLVLDI